MEFTEMSRCGSNSNGVKLLDAAAEGRADDAGELLARDPILIQFADAMGDTALHIAARAGHVSTALKMIEILEKLGHVEVLKDVQWESNGHGDVPMHLAVENGHKDLAYYLALSAARSHRSIDFIYKRNDDDKDARDLAKNAGFNLSIKKDIFGINGILIRTIMLVLDELSARFTWMGPSRMFGGALTADILMWEAMDHKNNGNNSKNGDKKEFIKLFKAAETNKEDVVEKILENNPNTLLECKVSEDILIKYNKDEAPMGWTALHVAAYKGNMGPLKSMVEFMQNNTNINLYSLLLEGDNEDNVPLHLAIKGGHEEVARYLLTVEPRAAYKQNRPGESPLFLATDKECSGLIRYMTRAQSIRDRLLEHAKNIHIAHYALNKRSLETFKAILEGLPDLIKVLDRKGWRLLSYAASKGYLYEVSYILKHFPDSARKADEDKSFPIHKAVAAGHTSVVKEFLLHCPQALRDIDGKGRNLVQIATSYGRNGVLSYLKENHKLMIG